MASTADLRVHWADGSADASAAEPVEVTGRGGLWVRCPDHGELWVAGERVHAVGGIYEDRRALSRWAGEVLIRWVGGSYSLSVRLMVRSTKLDPQAVDAMLDDLHDAAGALVGGSSPRRWLQEVERASEGLERAARTIVRSQSQTHQVNLTTQGVRRGVRSRRPQGNAERGVLGTLHRLEDDLDVLRGLLRDDRQHRRPLLEGSTGGPSGLSAALSERAQRLLERARATRRILGLPVDLPPLPRIPPMDGKAAAPGYRDVVRLGRVLDTLGPPEPAPRFQVSQDVDRVYENWVMVKLWQAFARWAGMTPSKGFQWSAGGEVSLRHGLLAEVHRGALSVQWWHQPSYAFEGEEPLVKLVPGRPYVPDAAMVVLRHGWPARVHLFDAKHRLDPGRPHDDHRPLEALGDLWFRYADGIGHRDSGLPAVASVWMLYPGRRTDPVWRVPAMASPGWPVDRVRGGSLGAHPETGVATEAWADFVDGLLVDDGVREESGV